jgi:hypothetical protein
MVVARRLQRQPFAIVAEVRLGVLATKRDLSDVTKMGFTCGGRHRPE